MSRYFVTDAPVAVPEFDPSEVISDTPPNVIYIRAKMDMQTKAKVTSELFTLGKDNTSVEARLGANELALLIHNIVRWEGPDLGGIPCTPETIRTLDPSEPHLVKVLDEIARRNRSKEGPSPKSATAGTSGNAGAAASSPSSDTGLSAQLATTTSRSPLLSAINGRPSRSDD